MLGLDFMYDGTWLSEYGMAMYDPRNEQTFASRHFDKSEITALRARSTHYGSTYDDVLQLHFLILKDDDNVENGNYRLDGDELHFIRSWLESPKKPTEIIVTMDEDEMTTHYYGIFSDVQPYVHRGDCVGLYLTFTCDAPYGFSDEYSTSFGINGAQTSVTRLISNISAERDEYLRPTIIINSSGTFTQNNSVVIRNQTDNNVSMTVALPQGKSKIVIDCEKRIVTDENGTLVPLSDIGVTIPISNEYTYVSTESYFFYWLALLPDDNRITVTSSATNTISTVEIKYKFIVKAGGF